MESLIISVTILGVVYLLKDKKFEIGINVKHEYTEAAHKAERVISEADYDKLYNNPLEDDIASVLHEFFGVETVSDKEVSVDG